MSSVNLGSTGSRSVVVGIVAYKTARLVSLCLASLVEEHKRAQQVSTAIFMFWQVRLRRERRTATVAFVPTASEILTVK